MKKRDIIKKIIGFVVFLSIAASVFSNITWIFRGNLTQSREIIFGFKNESNNIDVILFGASDVWQFHEPLEAWNKYGYTSFNYATSASVADMLRFMAEESRKTNEAELYVFAIRSITRVDENILEKSLRNWSDSLPVFSTVRLRGIASYVFNRDWSEEDIPSYFLDIIKYHTNYDSLSSSYQWSYVDEDSIYSMDKGFSSYVNSTPFERPNITDEMSELSVIQEKTINELLDYCDKEGLNALFFCSPIVIQEEDEQIINMVGNIIESRGYKFVDFNKHYDEIGINFETDFGDINHVNFLGAEKFTEYFTAYLKDNYDLPDHREDEAYTSWNEDYLSMQETREKWLDAVTDAVDSHMEAKMIGENLSNIEDLDTWLNLITNENFTVVIKKNEPWEAASCSQGLVEFISRYSIGISIDSYIGIWSGGSCLFASNDGTPADVNIGVDGGRGQDECVVSIGDTSILSIADNNYDMNDTGMQIVVYDNNYKKVVDNVVIKLDEGVVNILR